MVKAVFLTMQPQDKYDGQSNVIDNTTTRVINRFKE